MANDSKEHRPLQSDRVLERNDAPDGEQDVEGHYVRYRSEDDPGIGGTEGRTMARNDAPDGDDDVEGHFRI